ncbi:MAG: HAD family hydrolase [Francisellaceae bacterium]
MMEHNNLAIFDLDHTLVSIDCSGGWIDYMCDQGLIDDPQDFQRQRQDFDRAYRAGMSDIGGYTHFILSPMRDWDIKDISEHINSFIDKEVLKCIYPQAQVCLSKHRENGDELLLVSASIEDLVKPIGLRLGFAPNNIIGIETEKKNGFFSGNYIEPTSFGKGKCLHVERWLKAQSQDYQSRCFYSDSFNDRFLLQAVDMSFCVNPDEKLKTLSDQSGWTTLNWQH